MLVTPAVGFSARREFGGFTLVEVLVAALLFSAAITGVAQLVAMVTRSTIASRDLSYASVLALQKLSELMADRSSVLTSSPDAWMRSETGHLEHIDPAGLVVGTSFSPPGSAVYVRRWSVTPLQGDPAAGVLLQVSVGRIHRQTDGTSTDLVPMSAARVVGVHTRMVP